MSARVVESQQHLEALHIGRARKGRQREGKYDGQARLYAACCVYDFMTLCMTMRCPFLGAWMGSCLSQQRIMYFSSVYVYISVFSVMWREEVQRPGQPWVGVQHDARHCSRWTGLNITADKCLMYEGRTGTIGVTTLSALVVSKCESSEA